MGAGVTVIDDRVTVEMTAGVADVRLARAAKMNALDNAMFGALVKAGEQLRADATVRAVVLSGEGRAFCAGLDFASFGAMASGDGARIAAGSVASVPADSPARALGQHAVYVWRMVPAPVIAAVHGHALGGGFQLALGADLRVVAPDATLGVLEIRWGLVPDMCGTQLLAELVGVDVAKELTFTGRTVDGREALRLGLATRLSESPRDDALQLAGEIAAQSPAAIRGAKRLFDGGRAAAIADGLALEQEVIRSLIGTPDQIEAVTAHFEKRPAIFRS